MKISNASKKVLASALSAAMVVAFAPTVAFAAGTASATGTAGTVGDGEAVAITIDADGGVASQTAYTGFKQGGTIALPTATKNGYALDYWWYDANGDGKIDAGTEDFSGNTAFDLPAKNSGKTAVTLKAVYVAPSVNAGTYADGTGSKHDEGAVLNFGIDNDAAKVVAQHTYTVSVTNPDGKVLAENTFAPADNNAATKAALLGAAKVTFQANPASNANNSAATSGEWYASTAFLKSGEYTATLKDGDTVLSTSKVKLVKVTEVDGETVKSKFLVVDPATALTANYTVGTMIAGKSWVDAKGYAVSTVNLGADATYTSTAVQQVAQAGSYTDRVMTFSIADSTAAAGDKYGITVVDPSGATVYTGEKTATGTLSSTDVKFTFDQKYVGEIARANATEQAGEYVMTVVKTPADGTVASTSKAKATLTEVKYDAGEGKFASTVAESAKDYFVDGSSATVDLTAAPAVEAADGQDFDKWQIGEKTYAATVNNAKLTAGAVNVVKATYKAAAAKIATPTFTVEEKKVSNADSYVIKVATATAGADVYEVTSTDTAFSKLAGYDAKEGGIVIAKTAFNSAAGSYKFKAKYVAGKTDPSFSGKDSKVLTLTKNTDIATWSADTAGTGTTAAKLEALIGKSSTKWLAADGVKAAIESGSSAIAAQGVYTSASAKEMTATKTAAYKALYEAVYAEATAQLAKYADNALVVIGDKAYYVEASALKTANKAVDDANKAIAADEAAAANIKGTVAVAKYTAGIEAVIDATNAAIQTNAKASDLKAEEIKAAADVTAALKAAKTGDEAKAALEAYNKLSDNQKKLVASADVAAVQELATKAALVDAQDLAAARDLNGKKVTAKAKVGKKATGKAFTYKLAASESGATATYKKVSGSKYIKVSKSGKVSFKAVKVQKKAKTYSAKVSVTYGTQTVTKTVKLVVKKK